MILEIVGSYRSSYRLEENFGEGPISEFDKKVGWTAQVVEEGLISVRERFFAI